MSKRIKTSYPGVFYREAKRIGGRGTEKVFYVVYKKNGKIHEEKAGRQHADNMTAAKASGIRADLIEGKRLTRKEKRDQEQALVDAESKKWTIEKLFEEYIKSRPENKARATDEGRYKNYLEKPFGKKEPKDILPLDVDRLRIRLLKKKSPQTVKHILNLLTWIVNFGVKKNLSEGLSFHVQKPPVNNIKTEDLTADQLKKLLDAIEKAEDVQAAGIMKMALFTGMRRGEIFRLKWSDIDYERGFIHIRDPKGGPDQKIPLNDAARELLDGIPETEAEFIFPGPDGKKLTDISRRVNPIKEKAELPEGFRPLHGLRHVYASMLASSGQVDLYTLQKLLTHKSPQMTQRYAHLRDEALKKASNLAGNLINEAIAEEGKEKEIINLQNQEK